MTAFSLLAAPFWYAGAWLLDQKGLEGPARQCYLSAFDCAPRLFYGAYDRVKARMLAEADWPALCRTAAHAVEKMPGHTGLRTDLARALWETGRLEEADALLQTLQSERPADPDILLLRAHVLFYLEKWPEALQVLNAVPSGNADLARDTLRARVLIDADNPAEAWPLIKALEAAWPQSADVLILRSRALVLAERRAEALQGFQAALQADPAAYEAHCHLGLLIDSDFHLRQSLPFLLQERRRGRKHPAIGISLALVYLASDALGDALRLSQEIVERVPDSPAALSMLAQCFAAMGREKEALAMLEKVASLLPQNLPYLSRVLFHMHYLSACAPEDIFRRHQDWQERAKAALAPVAWEQDWHPSPDGRLRIGYVSPDFVSHPVGFLLLPILQRHDKRKVQVTCYSDVVQPDAVTEASRAAVDRWRDTASLDAVALSQMIRKDGIDILVDLTGHTRANRLDVFARKPAPVQVSWLGYFHSTGLDAIDYFITDPYSSPRGLRQHFSETPVALPHTRLCFQAPTALPAIGEPPHIANGYITFGSFNNHSKLSDATVACWSRILMRLPDARLILKWRGLDEEDTAGWIAERFGRHGVDRARLIFRPRTDHDTALREYADVDIALDPFPYTGGMTTFDALSMGVPVVTLAGETVVARQSTSILMNLRQEALVFATVDAYVDGTVALAQDHTRLADLRASLRQALLDSPLADDRRFTRDLEHLYRRMWEAHERGERLPDASSQQGDTDVLEQGRAADSQADNAPVEQPQAGRDTSLRYVGSVDQPEVSFIVCSIDDRKLNRLVDQLAQQMQGTPYEIIGIRDARSLTEAYNRGFARARADICVFCHDDLDLLGKHLWSRLSAHLKRFDIVGVAGTSRLVSAHWTGAGHPYLHGQICHFGLHGGLKVTAFDEGQAAREGLDIVGGIQALDGLFIAMHRRVLEAVQFDEETFDGFHGYDVDFTYRAYLQGFSIGVAYDLAILHESNGNFGAEWERFSHRFMTKHQASLPADGAPQVRRPVIGVDVQNRLVAAQFFELENRRHPDLLRQIAEVAAASSVPPVPPASTSLLKMLWAALFRK